MAGVVPDEVAAIVTDIGARERELERYWERRDPINALRQWWRAQVARQSFHILPGESILELGCGKGRLTSALLRATRGECHVTAVTFGMGSPADPSGEEDAPARLLDFGRFWQSRQAESFDYVVGTNLLDFASAPWVLELALSLLKPGGKLLIFESNPWNPVFQARRGLRRLLRRDRFLDRSLPNHEQLAELASEIGFIRVSIRCWDFLYRPIPRPLLLPARNLSLVLENTPGIRKLAGSLLVQAQKPPRHARRADVVLADRQELHGAVSFVIPCHNEVLNVRPLVEGIDRHYGPYVKEFVLVDDNSRDGTTAVIRDLAARDRRVRPVFRTPPNGVGRALRDGLEASTGEWVLLMDCDFLMLLPELREMFDAAAKGYDIVFGSRFSRESVLVNYPLRKILFNRLFHVLANLLFHRRMRDVTNNLKLMRREVAASFEIESPWFAANAETGLKPILCGFEAHAVPISWINRTPGMGHSTFDLMKNGGGYARVLGRLAIRTRFGFRRLPRRVSPASSPADGRPAEGGGR